MKIEQLLVQHLYNHKEVTLQGIGTFRLSDSVVLPADGDKDFSIPADGISFTYDPKIAEDGGLIDYIVQQTGKIKPLASADLDSYIMLSKQFLNIGKPLKIEGIGTLLKTQIGQYEYIPGQYISSKMEPAAKPLREKLEEDVSFRTAAKSTPVNIKKWALITVVAMVLGGAVYATWWYFTQKRKETPIANNSDAVKPETETAAVPDNSQSIAPKAPDSIKPATPVDGTTFKVVFKTTVNKADATARMGKLISWGHKVVMYTSDSVTYKLATPFSLPLSDTTRISDSLRKLYGGKVFVETQ